VHRTLEATGVINLARVKDKEESWEVFIDTMNVLYNAMYKVTKPYILSIDLVDFLELSNDETIKEASVLRSSDYTAVYDTYDKFFDAVKKVGNKYPNNQLLKFFKSETVNISQLLQCLVMCGFRTEVTGDILPNPVISNYLKGMYSAYDFIAESRSAPKALLLSEAPLQDAEYFARKLQLLTMTIEKVDTENIFDCGTDQVYMWRVRPDEYDEVGRLVRKGDINYMYGKYYKLDLNDPEWSEITRDSKDIIGKVIYMRSILGCKHPVKKNCCARCFGALYKNINPFAVVGHASSSTMTQQSSQSVLGAKHITASSLSNRIALTDKANVYFIINKTNEIFIRKEFKRNVRSIVVDKESAPALLDIFSKDAIENINPKRISSVSFVEFRVKRQNDVIGTYLPIAKYDKQFMFSYAFLKHIKEKGYKVDERNNFEFDMTDWDFDKPVFKYPEKEYSYSDHSKQISRMIESAVTDAMEEDATSPMSLLQELFFLVNSKLNVNIVCLEAIVLACSIDSENNYDLSRFSKKPITAKYDTIMRRRSLSAAYAYETLLRTVTSPHSFSPRGKPNTVIDAYIAPKETVRDHKLKRALGM
jgi:hypothetical protein